MSRTTYAAALLALLLAVPAHATCGMFSWNQTWFESDAVFYAAADLDGDDVAEIISSTTTTVSYRRPPDFAPFVIYSSTEVGQLVAADVTGEGNIDLLIPNVQDHTLVVLPGNGNGTFASAIVTSLAFAPSRLVTGQFSGDANVDVAVIGNAASVTFLEGDGTGAFTLAGTVSVAASPLHLASANFDGDARDDVAVSHTGTSTVEVLFSNGSGGAAVVPVSGGTAAVLAAGDVNEDGYADLMTARPVEKHLDTFFGSSSRTFSKDEGSNLFESAPGAAQLVHVSGASTPDLLLSREGFLDTYRRTTNGHWERLFNQLLFPTDHPNIGRSIAAADMTGDGVVDAVVENGAADGGVLLRNTCGASLVSISGFQFVLSVGQPLEFRVDVWALDVAPTGSVTARIVDHEITQTLTPSTLLIRGSAFGFQIDDLPVGLHELVVEYSGDGLHPPATGKVYVRVTTATTSTKLEGPVEWTYGQSHAGFKVTVTSSSGDTPTGNVRLVAHGWAYNGSAPSAEWPLDTLIPAGSFTFVGSLWSSLTHPRSEDSLEVTIHKASSTLAPYGGQMSREGLNAAIAFKLTPQFGSPQSSPMTGPVRLKEGSTILATTWASVLGEPTFSVSGLSVGDHTLQVVYDGDNNVEGTSLDLIHTVVPATHPFTLTATATPSVVRLDFIGFENLTGIYRRTNGSPWTFMNSTSAAYFFDFSAVAGTVYQYRLQTTHDGSTVVSNVETVYVGSFTDETLTAAKIRQVHFTEVQNALNSFRTLAGQSPLAINFTGYVMASHLAQLRTAVNEARVALGMPACAFSGAPVPGVTLIRAQDLLQLRDALR